MKTKTVCIDIFDIAKKVVARLKMDYPTAFEYGEYSIIQSPPTINGKGHLAMQINIKRLLQDNAADRAEFEALTRELSDAMIEAGAIDTPEELGYFAGPLLPSLIKRGVPLGRTDCLFSYVGLSAHYLTKKVVYS